MERSLKSRLVATCIAISLGAAIGAGAANAAGEPFFAGQSDINYLLAKNPKGGDNLSNGLDQSLKANPSSLGDLMTASIHANPAQQQEIGKSLADLAIFYGASDPTKNRLILQQIQTALGDAPWGVINAFKFHGGEDALLKFLLALEIDFIKEHCVSPSHPKWDHVDFPGGPFNKRRHCFDHW